MPTPLRAYVKGVASPKAAGLGDGPTHGESAMAKLRGLRLTPPPKESWLLTQALRHVFHAGWACLRGAVDMPIERPIP